MKLNEYSFIVVLILRRINIVLHSLLVVQQHRLVLERQPRRILMK
jgi:hypothetical protein